MPHGIHGTVGKVFPLPKPVSNIFYSRLIRDEDVFLFSYFPLYPSAYRVYAASYFLQSRGNFGVLKSEHHSLAIPIACDDLNQFRPTVHVDQFCQCTHIFVESSPMISVKIIIPHCQLGWCGYDHVKLCETIHIYNTEASQVYPSQTGFHTYIIQMSHKMICHEVEDLRHGFGGFSTK